MSTPTSQTDPRTTTDLEGVRLRHVVCTRCGYLPARVPIRDGAITCPECGHSIRFELLPPVRRRRRGWGLALSAMAWATIILVGVGIGSTHGPKAGLVASLVGAGIWWFLARLRRTLLAG